MENMIEIKDEVTGRGIKLSKDDYEMIAAYVRAKDRHDYAIDVLMNGITGQYRDLANVEEYIINDEKKVDEFSLILDDKINSDTGEIEYSLAEEWIRKESPSFYKAISNKGTEFEQEDTVILGDAQADAIRAGKWKGDLETVDDYVISTEFISELQFVSVYDMD